jgi:hypothetical protein
MFNKIMEWRRHHVRSACYEIMEKNYLFLDRLNNEELYLLFLSLESFVDIEYACEKCSNAQLSQSYINLFSRYKKIVIGADLRISYMDVLNTQYDFYPCNVVVIGVESGRPLVIKSNTEIIHRYLESKLDNILKENFNDNICYNNIYYYLLVALGSIKNLEIEKLIDKKT